MAAAGPSTIRSHFIVVLSADQTASQCSHDQTQIRRVENGAGSTLPVFNQSRASNVTVSATRLIIPDQVERAVRRHGDEILPDASMRDGHFSSPLFFFFHFLDFLFFFQISLNHNSGTVFIFLSIFRGLDHFSDRPIEFD